MFDVRRLVVFILESCLESPWMAIAIWFTIFIDSLCAFSNLAVTQTHACSCVTHVTFSYCVCLGLYLTLMRKEILGEWSMLMIYDTYGWPLHSPSISADSCSPTPSLQAHLKQETSDYTGVVFLLPFLFLPLCCWTTLFNINALFHPSVAVVSAGGGDIVVGLVEMEKPWSFIEVELNLNSVYQENLVIIKDQ